MGRPDNPEFVRPLLRARDWQERPQFAEVCDWWRGGGFGVCALIGIGGAGKTAIAERFLQVLPGGYPEHPRVAKDPTLLPAERLLVFSFYEAPNPDAFFAEVAAWLETGGASSYAQIVDSLSRAGRCLLVLDGLEKVQDDGMRGGAFGQIGDGRLRDLVLRVSDGWLPRVSLIITSRFRLFDPLAHRTYYYKQVGVEHLELPAAIQLLRDRGVQGPDEEVERVARELGLHALSVDLAGGYIERFHGGMAAHWKPFEFAELPQPGAVTFDPVVAAIREQERKFAGLAGRYEQALAEFDPATLALLQRICLFRLAVSAKTLASIFLGPEKEGISGPRLADLTEDEVEAKLALLTEMRLIEATITLPPTYTIHPAVRDGFLRGLDAEVVRRGHDAARVVFEISLGDVPKDSLSDPATLDLLEEMLYHTLQAGFVNEAFDIYWERIGAYRNLMHRLGALERGERICRTLLEARSEEQDLENRSRTMNDWGLYLARLGRLDFAAKCHELSLHREESPVAASRVWQNITYIWLRAGRLADARRAAANGLQSALNAKSDLDQSRSIEYRGEVQALLGDPCATAADFLESARLLKDDFRDATRARFFLRLGKTLEARDTAITADRNVTDTYGPMNVWSSECQLVIAEADCATGDLVAAREHLEIANDWARARDAKEPLCWGAFVRAKIELRAFVDGPGHEVALDRASSAIADGLAIARECGYGVYHIDLLLLRAQVALHEGRAEDAERDIRLAIDEGISPPPESGFPHLIAANDPECGYAWGIVDGHQLMSEALLLRAAQYPEKAAVLTQRARHELNAALQMWKMLRNPEGDAELHPKAERTKRVLELLDRGVLTEYPIATEVSQGSVVEKTKKQKRTGSVFISYAHADNEPPNHWLDRFRQHLAPLERQHDIHVWSDRQLKIGDQWDPAIRRQLDEASVAVLLISPAFLASEYIANSELPILLRRARDGGLHILPILLSPSIVHRTRFKYEGEEFTLVNLQTAATSTETVAELPLPQQDRVFISVAERIMELVAAAAP